MTHLDGSRRSRSRGGDSPICLPVERGGGRSRSASGVHGSAQRLKQGLEPQRCALGQTQIVDIPARTLQI